eukprot:jgi/Orpsp1_1/1179080/evm.model.c7180000067844.1
MIFVNNGSSKDGKNNKREEAEQRINSVIDEITALIVDNIDTYENLAKLEEFEQKSTLLRKRSNENNESALAYSISSLNDKTIIYSYLSDVIADKVEEIPNVLACIQDLTSDIQNLLIRMNVRLNVLSVNNAVVFPSKVDDYCEFTYGKEYHGLMVSDVAGGLTHGVANKANIYGIALEGEIDDEDDYPTEYPSDQPYPTDYDDDAYPTDNTSENPSEDPSDSFDVVSEKESKENVIFISGVLASLKYIDENMLRPNKAVFNFSFGIYFNKLIETDQYIIDYFRDFIDYMSSRGVVFVVAAGNDTKEVELNGKTSSYPCAFDNVICVGATDNAGMNGVNEILKEMLKLVELEKKEGQSEEKDAMFLELYKKYVDEYNRLSNIYSEKVMNPENYRTASFSNFGKKVEIYAPGYAEVEYRNVYGKNQKELTSGTSFSSPIVAGVVATIMSEHPEIKFDSKKMKEYLTEIGEKNIIEGIAEGNPNVFISNGKHSIYQGSDNEEVRLNDEKVSDAMDEVETDGYILDEVDDE